MRCSRRRTRWSRSLTRPDAPAGRGRQLARSPVAERRRPKPASRCCSPRRPREPEFLARLSRARPGRRCGRRLRRAGPAGGARHPGARLGQPALLAAAGLARRGAGAARDPAGDEITGATTFLLEAGLDTGPVLGMLTEPIRRDDTAGDLLDGCRSRRRPARRTLDGIGPACSRPCRSRPTASSLAPKITADDARVDWTTPARHVDRLVRACTPAPGAWTTLRGKRVKLGRCGCPRRGRAGRAGAGPGEIATVGPVASSAPRTAPVLLGAVQPEGKAADAARRTGLRGAALGHRRALRVSGPHRPHARATGAGRQQPAGLRSTARSVALDVLRRGRMPRGRTPTWRCRRCSRERQLDRRDAALRHRAGLRHAARIRAARRRSWPTCVDRADRAARPGGARRAAARRPPAARDAHRLLRRGARDGRPGQVPRRRTVRPGWSTPCCARSPRATSTDWVDAAGARRRSDRGGSRSRTAIRGWIVEAFADALDGDLEQTAAALAADNVRPEVALVARPGRSTVDGAARARRPARPVGADGGRSSAADRRGAGGRSATAERASRTKGHSWSRWRSPPLPVDGGDERWLDLCAGPGGKAALLGAIAEQRGARLDAAERQPHRAGLVGSRRRCDGRCRGRRRHPAGLARRDLRPRAGRRALHRPRRTAASSGGALAAASRRPRRARPLQVALLRGRAGRRPAWGRASPTRPARHTGRDACDRRCGAGARHPAAELVDARPLLPGVTDLGDGPDVQLWPHRHGTDAMFLALIRVR